MKDDSHRTSMILQTRGYKKMVEESNVDVDDDITISDRYLIDSNTSREGVNLPLNSLPKLSRHRKSDLAI